MCRRFGTVSFAVPSSVHRNIVKIRTHVETGQGQPVSYEETQQDQIKREGAHAIALEPQKDQTPLAAIQMSADTPGVIELTEHNFASSIDGHPFAVVDFWAPSCAPCRTFAPILAAAAARNPDILFARVNTEDQRAIGAQFNIRSIPTLMIFRSNIVVCDKAGALQANALDEVLRAARALDMEQVGRKVVSVDGVALGAPAAPAPTARTTDVDTQAAPDADRLTPASGALPFRIVPAI